MDPNRFTEKLQEALGRAQNAALGSHHQAVDVEHLLVALLEDEQGLASSIIKLAGADRNTALRKLKDEFNKLPRVTGSGADSGQVYMTQRLSRVLARAEQEAAKLKDEYISVEHALVATLDDPGAGSKILREAGLTHDEADGRAQEGARKSARDLLQSRGNLPGARTLRTRPDHDGVGRQARPGDRPRRGNPPRHPGAVAAHQE